MNHKTYLKIDFVIKNSRHSFPNHRKHSEKSVLFGAEPLIPVVLRLFSLIITVLVALWLRKKRKINFWLKFMDRFQPLYIVSKMLQLNGYI